MRALFVWQSFQVGVEVSKGTGRFLRTKVVRFVPRFEINNTTDRQLLVCQHQQPFTVLGHVPAKQTAPYHFPDLRVGALLKLKFGSDAAWAWSTPFGVADPGTVYVKMRRSYGAVEIARVDVRLNGATTQVVVSESTGQPPFRIVNESMISVRYEQAGAGASYTLHPGDSSVFAWDVITTSPVLNVHPAADASVVARFDLQRIHTSERFRFVAFPWGEDENAEHITLPPKQTRHPLTDTDTATDTDTDTATDTDTRTHRHTDTQTQTQQRQKAHSLTAYLAPNPPLVPLALWLQPGSCLARGRCRSLPLSRRLWMRRTWKRTATALPLWAGGRSPFLYIRAQSGKRTQTDTDRHRHTQTYTDTCTRSLYTLRVSYACFIEE